MSPLPFADALALLDALEQARSRRALHREGAPAMVREQARALCKAQGLEVDEDTLAEAVDQFQSIHPDTRPVALTDPVAQRPQTPWRRPATLQAWQDRQAELKAQERRWQGRTRVGVVVFILLVGLGVGLSFAHPLLGTSLWLGTQIITFALVNQKGTPWFQRPRQWRRELDQLDPLPMPILRAIRWWGVPAVTEQARQWLATGVPLLVGDGEELDARTEAARKHLRTKIGHRLLHSVLGSRPLF